MGRSDPGGYDAHIRIFTPATELPVRGTSGARARRSWSAAAQRLALVRLKTAAGVIPIALSRERDRLVYGEMEQPIPEFEPFDRADDVLTAVGVQRSRAAGDGVPQRPDCTSTWRYPARRRWRRSTPISPRFGELEGVGVSCFAGRGGRVQDAHVRPRRRRARGPGHRLGRGSARASTSRATAGASTAGRSRSARARRSAGPSVLHARVDGIRRADRAGRGRWGGSRCCPRASTDSIRVDRMDLNPRQRRALEQICDAFCPSGDGLPPRDRARACPTA